MKNVITPMLILCMIAAFSNRLSTQQMESKVKNSTDTSSAELMKARHMGKMIVVWAVMEKKDTSNVITTSYTPWLTQQEAIDGITKLRGKSWEALQKEGAKLMQRKMYVDDKSDTSRTK